VGFFLLLKKKKLEKFIFFKFSFLIILFKSGNATH